MKLVPEERIQRRTAYIIKDYYEAYVKSVEDSPDLENEYAIEYGHKIEGVRSGYNACYGKYANLELETKFEIKIPRMID